MTTSQHETPNATVKVGDEIKGAKVVSVTPIPQVRLTAVQLEHPASGARIIHLVTSEHEPEHMLCVGLRTPPPDNTGLPHILEHTVLCGSKRFPVKDPFTEMLKSSLATFINALTGWDATYYPCASMVEKDFFNLASVYCDAVFFPRISEMHFKQEGHHLAFKTPGDTSSPLTINGIVYNEMKGVFSSLDSTVMRYAGRALFPDNAYGNESGGDPDRIPELTYDAFVNFHKTYYHPSNSFIVVLGNMPTDRYVDFLVDEALSHFNAIDIDTTIAPQSPWTEPKGMTRAYPIGPSEDPAGKTAITLTVFTNQTTDIQQTLALDVLDGYLLRHAGSPLRKALIDSGLGEELAPSGYFNFTRDAFFIVGLKGAEPDRAHAIRDLIYNTLKSEVANGLDQAALEAEFHRYELSAREQVGSGPLTMTRMVQSPWMYDRDPLELLRLDEHLKALRQKVEDEPGYFEKLLQTLIIDNPHHLLYTFEPDPQFAEKKQQAFEAQMADRKARLSQEELDAIAQQQVELQAMQDAPNTAEDLATLPRLELDDVPREPIELDTDIEQVGDCESLRTDVFTNGINYAYLTFDLRQLPDELLDDLPLLLTVMRKMGAAGDDYVTAAQREAAHTGGIGASWSLGGSAHDAADLQFELTIKMKALDANFETALGVLHDRSFEPDLTDQDHFNDVMLQERMGYRSSFAGAGATFAMKYANRHLSLQGRLSERLSGVTQARRIFRYMADLEKEQPGLLDRLAKLRAYLASEAPIMTASFAGSDKAYDQWKTWITDHAAGRAAADTPLRNESFTPEPLPREGLASPMDVAYVGRAMELAGYTDPHAPAWQVIGFQLQFGYLWDNIRVKGGAYGAFARFSPLDRRWAFCSYRDPNVAQTLKAYDGVFPYIQSEMDLSEDAVRKAIIGTMKTIDSPIRPPAAAATALSRHRAGLDHQTRRDYRARLLSLTGQDIRDAADRLAKAYATSPICVVSSREKLEAGNTELPENEQLAIEPIEAPAK